VADCKHDERAHSLRSPSKAPIYTKCPGAPRLWEKMGADHSSSEAARLGTAKHTLIEMVLQSGMDADDFIGHKIEVEGQTYTVDADFAKDVQSAYDMVWEVIGDDDGRMLLELRVPLDNIVGPGESGNLDLAYLSEPRKRVTILDHKFGRKPVKAEQNPSLLAYMGGLLDAQGMDLDAMSDWTFTFAIAQPAQGSPSVWSIDGKQLRAELDGLRVMCAASYEPDAALVMGNHCFFCQAKPICPEMQREVGSLVFDDPGFDNLDDPIKPDELTPEAAAKVLPALGAIEQWIDAFREHWQAQWLNGVDIPGWKVVEGRNGARQWTDKKAVEDMMANKFRIPAKEMYTQNLVTPSAAEKLLSEKSPRRWAQLQEMIKQSKQKPSLAPDDAPQPPMQRATDDNPFA